MTDELGVAIDAALAAGEVLRSHFRKAHDIRYKGPIDIVTEADHIAEARIIELLRIATPDYGFLAEEIPEIPGKGQSRWIIDPLDGTVNYSSGYPHFCVSIALERAGLLDIGVIYDPMREELFAAQRSGGATLNGEPILVGNTNSITHAVISTGFPYDAWTSDQDNAIEVAYFVKRVRGLRSTGSAALDLAAVACGRRDAHWECGLATYDVAAGTILIREAGGVVTDYDGNPNVLFAKEILAANSDLHREMLSYLETRHRVSQVTGLQYQSGGS